MPSEGVSNLSRLPWGVKSSAPGLYKSRTRSQNEGTEGPHSQLYESIDDQRENEEGNFRQKTMLTGGLFLPSCSSKRRYGSGTQGHQLAERRIS